MTSTSSRRTTSPARPARRAPESSGAAPLERGLLDKGACDEPTCMSGYAGVHSDKCPQSTAKRCILCFGPYHGDGMTCIRCNREIRAGLL